LVGCYLTQQFSQVPTSGDDRDAWIQNLGLDETTANNPKSVVCSRHFRSSAFYHDNTGTNLSAGALPLVWHPPPEFTHLDARFKGASMSAVPVVTKNELNVFKLL
jgi:hypothetical protein